MVRYSLASLVAAILWLSPHALAEEVLGPEADYHGKNPCPLKCSVTGPEPKNWPVYRNFERLHRCDQRFLLDFSVSDNVDERQGSHRIRACTLWGSDWTNIASPDSVQATEVNATLQFGSWDYEPSLSTATTRNARTADVQSLVEQMSLYLGNGHGEVNRTVIVYGLSGNATFGVYLGKSLQNEGMGQVALDLFRNYAADTRDNKLNGLAMQLCGRERDTDHAFGAIAMMNGSFHSVQDAIRTWSNGGCLDGFSSVTNMTVPIFVTAPPLVPVSNATIVTLDTVRSHSAGVARSVNDESGLSLSCRCFISSISATPRCTRSELSASPSPK
ncbi:hypothetical protein V494_00593 [Pseudogymnoascus sp. VKM F-4513 (FW-928)]|nr:hypothetical protein V494_00593 [Pseudogymnoascus sp. VKM F-4513 (FW-928)]